MASSCSLSWIEATSRGVVECRNIKRRVSDGDRRGVSCKVRNDSAIIVEQRGRAGRCGPCADDVKFPFFRMKLAFSSVFRTVDGTIATSCRFSRLCLLAAPGCTRTTMQAASERPHPHLQYARSRIGNACDSCKARKVKCDGKAPCGYCVRRRVADTCHYSPQKRRNAHAHLPRPPPSTPGHADRARTSVSSPNREDQTQASVVEQATGSQQPPDPSNEEETDVPREARLLKDAQGKLVFIGDCAPLSVIKHCASRHDL